MRFEHNYLKELIDEENQIDSLPDAEPETERPDSKEDKAIADRFIEGLIRMRSENLARKRADGLCMSIAAFKRLVKLADNLASRTGLDCMADYNSQQGLIILTLQYFDLSKDETPELVESLIRLFARADLISISPVSKYNRDLAELCFTYDLAE